LIYSPVCHCAYPRRPAKAHERKVAISRNSLRVAASPRIAQLLSAQPGERRSHQRPATSHQQPVPIHATPSPISRSHPTTSATLRARRPSARARTASEAFL
jgi:hypothetical protein